MKGGGVGKFMGLEQHAFLHKEAADTLKLYFKTREELRPEDPVFSPVRGEEKRLTSSTIRSQFLLASEKSGVNLSPHDFRRFVQTQLEAARIQPNWIRKIMGKIVRGEESPYSMPKIEQLRDAFKSAMPYLTLTPKADETRLWKMQALQNLELLHARGQIPDTEFMQMKEHLHRSNTHEEYLEGFKLIPKSEPEIRIAESEEEMLRLLNLKQGWEIQQELNGGGRFIMKRIR
jgi:hypothetical protein